MRIGSRLGLFADFTAARLRFRRRTEDPAAGRRREILVIRCDRIGDFALWAPFAAALRAAFPAPEYRLTLLGNELWLPLARVVLDFDDCLGIEPRRFTTERRYRRKLLDTIRATPWAEVWQCRPFREPWVEDLIALTAAAPRTVGFAAGARRIHPRAGRHADVAYTELVSADDLAHEISKNAAFAAAASAGRVPAARTECFRRLPEPPAPWRRGGYAVLLPGGSKDPRCRWAAEFFAELCRTELPELPVAIAGTADELPVLRRAADAIGPRAVPVGDLALPEFAALVAGARIVVGNDTGGIHLAAMSGVPAAAAVGAGVPKWFFPYPGGAETLPEGAAAPECALGECSDAGCFWQCRHPDAGGMYPCFAAVTVDAMRDAVRRAVAKIAK